jgi:hypothetical protein
MLANAIIKYLHSTTISKKEVLLIKELIQENKVELKNFLPKNNKDKMYFLTDLLQVSLKDHKNNKEFIDSILAFKDKDNQESFYYCLSNSKYGLELIKNNPILFNDNIDKSFSEILEKGSSKSILEFVKENKDKIKTETIYGAKLDIKIVQAIEKEGFTFDQRILNVVICKSNLKKPADLLKYMEKIEPNCEESVWNKSIISMLNYYNRELWDWNGKDRFGDCFALITKLKNPSQYKWGQKFNSFSYFSFNDATNTFFKDTHRLGYPSITGGNPIDIVFMKDFFKKNDIYFDKEWNHTIINNLIDDLSDSVLANAIQSNWPRMFRFEKYEYDKNGKYREDIIFDSLYDIKEHPVFQSKRVRKMMLREYFSQYKYRLDNYGTQTLFNLLGLSLESVINDKVLANYTDVLNQEDVAHICKVHKIKNSVAEKIAAEFQVEILNKELGINSENSTKRQFKI